MTPTQDRFAVLRPSDRPLLAPTAAGRAAELAFGQRPGLHAGCWEADVGSFEARMTVDELLVVLEGRARIAIDDAAEIELGPGDTLGVASGARCRWTVLEPVRTRFAYVD